MRWPSRGVSVRGLVVGVALCALMAAGARRFLPEPPLPRPAEGARLVVPARAGFRTMVGFVPLTPPPWSGGNCFTLPIRPESAWHGSRFDPGYHVANMHVENFEEVVRRLKLATVEVQYVRGCFLVVDARIPRRWLRREPCSGCTGESAALRAGYAERFRATGDGP